MLVSHSHRFIFVHVPKTAGLSLAACLAPYAQDNARKGWRRMLSHLPVPEDPRKVAFRVHASARWAKLKLPPALFESYRKFAVTRNPYDRAVSYFHYLTQRQEHHRHKQVRDFSFPKFLDYLAAGRDDTQAAMVADSHGRLLIGEVLRFENLDADFARLCRELGLPDSVKLPVHNVSDRGHYLDYYKDDGVRRQVEAVFRADFETFGYAMDPNIRAAVAAPDFNPKA